MITSAQSNELRLGSAAFASPWDRLAAALLDLYRGFHEWRSWSLLALMEVRRRYRRSLLGQFWLTLSMAVTIAGIGYTYGGIFNHTASEYIPFLGIGLIVWGLISGLVNDLAASFIGGETYLQSYPGPRSFVIYSAIAKNLIYSAHNFCLVPLLLLTFSVPITWATPLFLVGLCLITLNAVWIGMILGPLCARFRDLLSIVTSVMQLMFFLTPIMFKPAQIQQHLWFLTALNPFAGFVEITRAPLLGSVPSAHHYLSVALVTVFGFLVAFPFYARFRGRILYWL